MLLPLVGSPNLLLAAGRPVPGCGACALFAKPAWPGVNKDSFGDAFTEPEPEPGFRLDGSRRSWQFLTDEWDMIPSRLPQ